VRTWNVIGVLLMSGMWCLIGFWESVECSRSVISQRNVMGVLRACRMWYINYESA